MGCVQSDKDPDGPKTNKAIAKHTYIHMHIYTHTYIHMNTQVFLPWSYLVSAYVHTHMFSKYTEA